MNNTLTYPIESLQHLFNRVWEYAVIEKHPQCLINNDCAYTDLNGNRCWIGACLPDEATAEFWEMQDDKHLHGLQDADPEGWKNIFGDLNVDIMFQLQQIHDDWDDEKDKPWDEYVNVELTKFAKEYKLTIPQH